MRLSRRRMRRLELLEADLGSAPPEHRLAIALRATGEVFWAAGVTPLERDAAARGVVSRLPPGWQRRPELAEEIADSLAEKLATDERRAAVRRAVQELAADVRERLPRLAVELNGALARRVPAEDAAADLIWVAAVARSIGRE